MYKQSRTKIVRTMIVSMALFVTILLAVIFIWSAVDICRTHHEMLSEYSERFLSHGPRSDAGSESSPSHKPDKQKEPPDRKYDLAVFYGVLYDDSGNVVLVDNSRTEVYERQELVDLADGILKSGRASGVFDGKIYIVTERDNKTLVALMDNTLVNNSLRTILQKTVIASLISAVFIVILASKQSKFIIAPLEENDRLQKQFISDAGHELKTPVAVIESNADILQRESGENKWLSNIRYENRRMGELVKALLNLSRIESDHSQSEDVDLSNIVECESDVFISLAEERGLKINRTAEDNLIVKGDASNLSQLVAILLDNAVHYCSGGECIDLDLRREGRSAVLTVSNPCEEMSKEQLEHMFERFYRADTSRSSSGDESHYGLGLPIAKAIVRGHDGSISASQHDGWVSFTVRLPIYK